jgi:hypothetical protein
VSPFVASNQPGREPSMSVLATGAFWAATVERAVRTTAQAAIGVLTTNATGLAEIDWAAAGSVVGIATALSVLTSIAATGVGNVGPSLSAEVLTPPAPPIPADDAPPEH